MSRASDLAELRRSLPKYEARRRWWRKHHEELARKYAEQFVAVRDGVVIAANADLVHLLHELRSNNLDRLADVDVELVTARSRRLAL